MSGSGCSLSVILLGALHRLSRFPLQVNNTHIASSVHYKRIIGKVIAVGSDDGVVAVLDLETSYHMPAHPSVLY